MATNNPIELLVTLGVDTESSKDNINKYIKELKTQVDKLDITIKINGDANFARKLSEQLDGLKEDTKELAQALENIGKKKYKEHALKELDDDIISSMKSLKELTNYLTSQNHKYKVEMGVDEKGFDRVKRVVAEVKTEFGEIHTVHIKPEFDKEGKVIESFKKVGSAIQNLDTYKLEENISKANEQLIRFARQSKLSADEYALFESKIAKADTNDELEKTVLLMKQLAESNSFDNKFDKTIAKATYELDKLNESMDRFLKKNARNTNMAAINEFRANVENARKLPVNDDSQAGALAQEVKKLKDDFITLTASAADLEKFKKRVAQINKDIAKIGETGLASKKHVQFLYDQIKNVPLGHLDKLEKKSIRVTNVLSGLTEKKFILNGIESNINNVVSLNAQLERAYNLNKRYADKKNYAGLQNSILELSKVNINSVTDVDNATKKYKQLSEQIKLFAADATQQSRNSMTLVNQLKVAFERFPIWMIASTAFYSAVRSTKAFIDVLVDLDSKLVSIEKVAGSGDIATIFDSATQSAERFGQSISAVLDAYIEFSRQGYKGLDLVNLSSAGLVTANVGEITAQQASEYLTSALIQWNKETSDAMGIIDSWNEIANNYATTVEKLAQGHARSAATAKSMGIEFDQLNGIIGAVTAATKQSGDEVGKIMPLAMVT